MSREKVYLNFPISLVPPIYEDEDVYQALNNVIIYGLMLYVKKHKVSVEEAGHFLGITVRQPLESFRELYDRVSKTTTVMTSIDKKKAFYLRDARKSYKDNRDEIIALCGELAVRSIVGVKEYTKCYRGMVLSRMAGFAKVIDESLYPKAIKKLSGDGGKRQWRKLISSLKYAGCSVYTPKGSHGFYVSFRLSPIELAEKVERKERAKGIHSEYDLNNEQLQKIAHKKLSSVPLK